MRLNLAISLVSSVLLLAACGAKTNTPSDPAVTAETAPELDMSADVRASLPANTPPFDVHMAALKQLADDLNAVETMSDAMKLKKRIAANVLVMNSSLKEYEAESKANNTSAINRFRSRQNEYKKAMENYMLAMRNLSEKDPKIFGIVAMEIGKVARLQTK